MVSRLLTRLPRTALIIMVGVILAAVCAAGTATAARLITGAQVKNGSLTGADIKDGSLGNPDLRRNSIRLDKLRARDVQALIDSIEQRPGPAGPAGPTGPPGPPGGPGGMVGETYEWNGSFTEDGTAGWSTGLLRSAQTIAANSLVIPTALGFEEADWERCAGGASVVLVSNSRGIAVINYPGPAGPEPYTVDLEPHIVGADPTRLQIDVSCAGADGQNVAIPSFDFTARFVVYDLTTPQVMQFN